MLAENLPSLEAERDLGHAQAVAAGAGRLKDPQAWFNRMAKAASFETVRNASLNELARSGMKVTKV